MTTIIRWPTDKTSVSSAIAIGDCFTYYNGLYMKISEHNCVALADGKEVCLPSDAKILPVNIIINIQ